MMPLMPSSMAVSVVKPSGKPQRQYRGVFDFPGDDGARAVAKRVPQELRSLALDFGDCDISKAGACAVAKSLPRGLSSLSLNIGSCDIGKEGVRAMAELDRDTFFLNSLTQTSSGVVPILSKW